MVPVSCANGINSVTTGTSKSSTALKELKSEVDNHRKPVICRKQPTQTNNSIHEVQGSNHLVQFPVNLPAPERDRQGDSWKMMDCDTEAAHLTAVGVHEEGGGSVRNLPTASSWSLREVHE